MHNNDVIMNIVASQITSLTIVCSTVYSGADQRKHQNSASLAFLWGIHWWPVNSLHKGPVTQKMFPFDDVIMETWLVCKVVICKMSLKNWYVKLLLHLSGANKLTCHRWNCQDIRLETKVMQVWLIIKDFYHIRFWNVSCSLNKPYLCKATFYW